MNFPRLLLALVLLTAAAQNMLAGAGDRRLSRSYRATPMSEALVDISRECPELKLSFIYNTLEDYPVTCSFMNLTPVEAVYKIVGLYPVRVSFNDDGHAVVEPLRRTAGKLIGRLVNERGEAVEYANVRLFSPADSTFITGGISTENGDFVIPTDAANAIMNVTCLGYFPLTKNISVGRIGDVVIHTSAQKLDNVTVESKTVDYVGDHLEVIPSATTAAHALDIFSFLSMQPLPGLWHDKVSNRVTAFNAPIIFVVNGVERPQSYLYNIQPRNVARIKYYTQIPAKYLDRGAGAVLEITLKERNDGGSFYINGQQAVNALFTNTVVGFSYNQGKSETALQYSNNYRNYHRRYETSSESYIGDDGFRVDIDMDKVHSPMHYFDHDLSLSYTLRPDDSSALIARGWMNASHSYFYTDGAVSDSYLGDYHRFSRVHRTYISGNMSLYYQKNWQRDRQLEIQATGSAQPQKYERILADTFSVDRIEKYPSDIDTKFYAGQLSASYRQPLNDKNYLTVNVDNYYRDTRSHYLIEDFRAFNKDYQLNAFAALTSKVGSVTGTVKGGLNLHSIKNNSQQWTRAFANADLNVSVPADRTTLTFTASLGPIIPSLSSFIENYQEYDGYLWVTGNSQLKTGYRLDLQQRLWWSHRHFWLNATVSETNMFNGIYTATSYVGDGKFVSRTENSKSAFSVESSVAFGLRELFGGKLTARMSVSHRYSRYRLKDNTVNTYGAWAAEGSVFGYFGKWTVGCGYRKPLRSLWYNRISQEENNDWLGVIYNVGKRLSVSASWMYITGSKGTYYPSQSVDKVNPARRESYIKDNRMMLTFNVSYNIDFGRIFKRVSRNLRENSGSADVKVVQ